MKSSSVRWCSVYAASCTIYAYISIVSGDNNANSYYYNGNVAAYGGSLNERPIVANEAANLPLDDGDQFAKPRRNTGQNIFEESASLVNYENGPHNTRLYGGAQPKSQTIRRQLLEEPAVLLSGAENDRESIDDLAAYGLPAVAASRNLFGDFAPNFGLNDEKTASAARDYENDGYRNDQYRADYPYSHFTNREYWPAEQSLRTNPSDKLDFNYHNHEQMSEFLRRIAADYSNFTELYSIGKSVEGRELWVMVITSMPRQPVLGKPNVKYVANIHGNEAVGRELMLHLIEHLVTNYNTDSFIKWLMDNTRIHILPSMNPDGFEMATPNQCEGIRGRYNADGYDLNRNFPDYFKENRKQTQPETIAVEEWSAKIPFVVSGGIHGGALVASYPYDNVPNSGFQVFASTASVTPDDDVFKHLALTYAENNPSMRKGLSCKAGAPAFPNGITNGAAWYPLVGGMQDYNYVWHGCMEVTLEISCCKYPPASELATLWDENKISLIKYLAEAHKGVHGLVFDENGNLIRRAVLKIEGRPIGFRTSDYGEFWRILLPGNYKLQITATGYLPKQVDFTVTENQPTYLNVTLHPSKNLSLEDPSSWY